MNVGELLYPLPSVECCVTENLTVYPFKNNKPNVDIYSHVGHLASEWVNIISEDDDNLLTELIYWNERIG